MLISGKIILNRYFLETKIMKQLKGILFDLYDTLTYADQKQYEQKSEKCANICNVQKEDFSRVWKSLVVDSNIGKYPKTEDRVRETLKLLRVPPNIDMIEKITNLEHEFLENGIRLFDDAIETLINLRKSGLKLGLVTNASPSVRIVIEKNNIDEYMDCIVISSDVRVRKPDERIYHVALKKLDFTAQECMFVGDGNDGELDGAYKVGLETIWIKRNLKKYVEMNESSLSSIDYTIGSLSEIVNIIKDKKNE